MRKRSARGGGDLAGGRAARALAARGGAARDRRVALACALAGRRAMRARSRRRGGGRSRWARASMRARAWATSVRAHASAGADVQDGPGALDDQDAPAGPRRWVPNFSSDPFGSFDAEARLGLLRSVDVAWRTLPLELPLASPVGWGAGVVQARRAQGSGCGGTSPVVGQSAKLGYDSAEFRHRFWPNFAELDQDRTNFDKTWFESGQQHGPMSSEFARDWDNFETHPPRLTNLGPF